MISNFFCFPPKASQNNGSHLKKFLPKCKKIAAGAARIFFHVCSTLANFTSPRPPGCLESEFSVHIWSEAKLNNNKY